MKPDQLVDTLRSRGVDDECIQERFDGDPALYAECFQEFLTEQSFEALDQALNEKEYKTAFSAAHSMKGLAANLSLREMYRKLCELVEALRGGDYENLDDQYQAVLTELAMLQALVA